MSYFRSHNCGELSVKDIDKKASVSGWINKKRDHGGVLFIDLRDHFGITQCVVNSDNKMFSELETLKLESIIKITGKVVKRSLDTINDILDDLLIDDSSELSINSTGKELFKISSTNEIDDNPVLEDLLISFSNNQDLNQSKSFIF